jgi:hypothetical protein
MVVVPLWRLWWLSCVLGHFEHILDSWRCGSYPTVLWTAEVDEGEGTADHSCSGSLIITHEFKGLRKLSGDLVASSLILSLFHLGMWYLSTSWFGTAWRRVDWDVVTLKATYLSVLKIKALRSKIWSFWLYSGKDFTERVSITWYHGVSISSYLTQSNRRRSQYTSRGTNNCKSSTFIY